MRNAEPDDTVYGTGRPARTAAPGSQRSVKLNGDHEDPMHPMHSMWRVSRIRIEEEVLVNASVVAVREWQRFEKRSECAPDQPLGWFERLLADLSATFINAPSEQVNGILQDALGRVADSLNLDRSTLWAAEDGDLVRSHDWTRPGFRRRVWLAAPARVSARELLPWSLEKANAGELVKFSSVDEVPNEVDRASYRRFGTKSVVAVPLRVGGRSLGVVAFSAVDAERSWPSATVSRLQLVASAFAGLLARRQSDESLRTALAQVSQLKAELQAEHVSLRKEMQERNATGVVIGHSLAVRRVEEQVRQVATTDSTVLLLGETGSGKEMFATQVHEMSSRRGRAMVRVNCAAIPATLIESELFGREKGAYTGALARQIGRFEMADHSTIFLDEIGDLPLEVQVKLLRVLEEKQIERLGCPKPIRVDTRIIAATHRDLEQRIAEGTFREDLYLPALRLPDPRAAASQTRGRHTASRLAIRRGVCDGVWQAHRLDRKRRHGVLAAVPVAGEHPRATERGRAGDDRGDGPTLDVLPARDVRHLDQAQREAGRRRERAHPLGGREHRLAHPWSGRGR